jgi:nucleotide-binding universal stress UspA family protein
MNKINLGGENKQTLVWAIDPRQAEVRPSVASVDALVTMAERMGLKVKPVSVFSPSSTELERGLFQSVGDTQARLDAYVKGFASLAHAEPTVLVAENSGQEEAVKKLMRFSLLTNAAAIAVSSHGWSGIERLFLGSFAETALRLAPLPVFFLNHAAAPAGEAVFFPTDFSPASLRSYNAFLARFAGSKYKVVLFNEVTIPLPTDMGLGVYVPDSFLVEQASWAREQAVSWVAAGRLRGLEVTSIVRVGGVGSVNGQELLAGAKEFNAGLVVLTTKSSVMGRTFFGSIAFPIFRANHCLTLVYGPGTVREEAPRAASTIYSSSS